MRVTLIDERGRLTGAYRDRGLVEVLIEVEFRN